jgi:hypothetical protein
MVLKPYYLGFMAYEGDDYKEATKYFDAVSGEENTKRNFIIKPI